MTDIYTTIETPSGPVKYKVDRIDLRAWSLRAWAVTATVGKITGTPGRTICEAVRQLNVALKEHHKTLVLQAKGEPCIKCGSTTTRSNEECVRCDDCFAYYSLVPQATKD